jgi:mono/diheme cytochrome c family protein/glucose/arabinose dehydrogenase
MRLRILSVILATWASSAAWAPLQAQNGDEKGEVQVVRVPAEKIPPAPPLAPAQALQSFRPAPGTRVDLVASEPMVEVPIVAQFDPDGRLWVVEMCSFMPNADGRDEDQSRSRISILEDTDGDGRMDRKTVFLDGLVLPRALLLIHGGVLVCEPPRLWFYPNEKDRPGPRVLVAEDFAKEADPKLGLRMNPEHSGNSLMLAIDNWVYSLYHPYRYRRAGGKWIREPNPQRVQWGLSQDDFGRLFYTSNSDQLRGDVLPSHYFGAVPGRQKAPGLGQQIARDQMVWPVRVNPGVNRGYQPDTLRADGTLFKFTAACGTCIYRGELFPAEFSGNAFVCEPSANVVRRNVLTDKDGVVTAQNAYDKAEFLASTDELFRPVNLLTGPDGGLYVVDMYHGIIQHRVFLTSYLRAQAESRGLQNVTNRGRIWRVGPSDKSPATPRPRPALTRATSAELAATLAHPNGWWRDTAQRLLIDRNDAQIVPALENLARTSASALGRLHALWTLEGLSCLSEVTVRAALADTHSKVRAAAVRLAEPFAKTGSTNSPMRATLLGLARDPSADVRIQLALSLGELGADPAIAATLAALAQSPAPLARETAAYVIARQQPPKALASTAPVRAARPLTDEEKKRIEAGRGMYEATCLACHQQHGLGQPGLAPPLVDSEWVSGPATRLVRIVLHGLRGPIKVKGESFELDMPALGALDDEQIAQAVSFVRREWGHTFDPVDPALVKKIRDETAAREDAWTEADLLKIQ